MTGTPTQAIKFSLRLRNGMGERFLADYIAGKDVDHWMAATASTRDTAIIAASVISFPDFCKLNPET